MSVPSRKYSTVAIVPSASAACALTVMLAGALKVALGAGLVRLTEGGDEGLRAVTDIFEFAPTRTPRRWGAIRVLALNRLDSSFLINRQHDRIFGRMAVQGADFIDLLSKLRVGAV